MSSVTLERVLNPSADELEEILRVLDEGFQDEAFAHRFTAPSPAAVRALHMTWLGPALIEGNVWVGKQQGERGVQGVGIWSAPGHLLSDTAEQRRFGESYEATLPPADIVAARDVKKRISADRDARYPGLWRDTFHLHVLVTLPSARGRGIGQALVNEMIRQADTAAAGRRGQESRGMSLSTQTEANRRFYEKCGFRTLWETELVYPSGDRDPYIVLTRACGVSP